MFKFKKTSALLACCMTLSILASGCGNSADSDTEEITPNVITSADADASSDSDNAAEGTTAVPAETEIVTDSDGNPVTGINGDVLTEPVTNATTTGATLSDEDIAAIITAATTQPTAVIDSGVDSSTKYPYSTLTETEKELYDTIVESAMTMTFRIRGFEDISFEEWVKVFGMVYNQEPQLFWLNTKTKQGKIYFNESDTEKIASMQKEIDATVSKIMADADKESTTYGKLKVFHDYLVLNATFEEVDDAVNYNQSIYNAFVSSSSGQCNIQCSGYAKAVQYLCDKAGIDCMVITGTNKSGTTHAWNKVKVDGEWYNFDCTWDDPILSTPKYTYIRHNYFLVPDEWINEKTHFNINVRSLSSGSTITYFTPPAATATAQNYFIKNGLVYNDADSADKALKNAIDSAVSSGSYVVEIMIGSKDVYNTVKSKLKDYQDYATSGHSNVSGLADNCNDNMYLIQLNINYK